MSISVCCICGKEFKPYRSTQKKCSDLECMKKYKAAWAREDYKKNPERALENSKKWHEENRERLNKSERTRMKEDKEYYSKRYSQNQDYRKRNPDKIREYNREYSKTYRKEPKNRIANNLRSRLRMLITRDQKSASMLELIGCSWDELKLHLESQFTTGMSWDNYGDWHIDHRKACANFDLTLPEEQKKCFHYTNLSPMWAADNIRKGKK